MPSPGTSTGYRFYADADLDWLRFLIRLRETGMPIRGMQRFAELRCRGDETAAERRRMLEAHTQEIREQIEQLERDQEARTKDKPE